MKKYKKKATQYDTHRRLTRPFVVFRGGGYDGCFWERNIVEIDRTTQGPVAVMSGRRWGISGYRGEEFLKLLREDGLWGTLRANPYGADRWERFRAELIWTEAQWAAFQTSYNEGFVRGVAVYLELELKCQRCNIWCDPDEIVHTGYHGDGGVGITFTDNKCRECADEEHIEWCAREWGSMRLKDRKEWVEKHNRYSGSDKVSIFAIRRDEWPHLYAEVVCEPDYY